MSVGQSCMSLVEPIASSVPMLLSSFLHSVEASHLADCRGSRVYLDFYLAITTNVPRFHSRRGGHVQFPNRLPRRIGSKREEFSTSGKHEAPLNMLEKRHPESAFYTCVSVDTQNGLRRAQGEDLCSILG